MIVKLIFWLLLLLIIYSYFGYTLLLIIYRIVKLFQFQKNIVVGHYEPEVTIVIAAYNEENFIKNKVENLRKLDYPKNKLHILWITDGSTDNSTNLLQSYNDMLVIHETQRKGKIGAVNRGMEYVTTEITIFCDANNLLSKNAVKEIVSEFSKPNVGCVAGEKKIIKQSSNNAVSSGEGFYWLYESFIKRLESDINSTIGAAGEIFAIRTELFSEVEPDTILDDFVISMRIAEKGFKIKYAPEAIAEEFSSISIKDEMKRKIRIAAGSFQTIPRISSLLNPGKHGFLSIQYWSHKVLRWTIVPFAMIILIPLNIYLAIASNDYLYKNLLTLQVLFYFFAYIGYIFRKSNFRLRILFAPYYLLVMNTSVILGLFRFLKGNQSVNWEKAR